MGNASSSMIELRNDSTGATQSFRIYPQTSFESVYAQIYTLFNLKPETHFIRVLDDQGNPVTPTSGLPNGCKLHLAVDAIGQKRARHDCDYLGESSGCNDEADFDEFDQSSPSSSDQSTCSSPDCVSMSPRPPVRRYKRNRVPNSFVDPHPWKNWTHTVTVSSLSERDYIR